jgi:hypothetical protein
VRLSRVVGAAQVNRTEQEDDRGKEDLAVSLIKFLASPIGRLVRIVAGIALIVIGLLGVKDTGGIVLAVIGLAPLLAGVFDFCVFAPLFGASFSRKAIRGER